MKVLFLCHPEVDIGEFSIFDGLCELLGDENVVTYPYKKIYNGQVADDYFLDDGKKGYTPSYDYMLKRNQVPKTMEEIKKEIDSFDFVILASPRTYALRALGELRSKLCQPLIFHESEDYEDIRFDLLNELRPQVFFKRTLRKDGKNQFFDKIQYNVPIYPLPLAAVTNTAPKVNDTDKKYNVWCVQSNTYPLREKIFAALKTKNYESSIIDFDGKGWSRSDNRYSLQYEDFMTTIAQSRIGVCSRGWSDDMQKRLEIPTYETLMVTHERGYIEPNEFTDQKNCIYYKLDLSDLIEKVDYYLQDENETRRIAKEGKNFLYKYHTSKVRAKEFIDISLRHA